MRGFEAGARETPREPARMLREQVETGVSVAQGRRVLLIADGTNVVRVTPDT
mgnify:FL=1